MLDFLGVIATTPRVGQNAVLGSLRSVVPGAGEWGLARPSGGILIYSAGYPVKVDPTRRRMFVRISRRDRVAQAVSWSLAAKTGRFHSHQPDDVEVPEYDRADIDRALATIADSERRWDSFLAGHDHLSLEYEADIEQDPTAAAKRILDYFGIPGDPGPTDVRRFSSGTKREWIDRWETAT